MNRSLVITVTIACAFTGCVSQAQDCDLIGAWIVKQGRFTKNYEMSFPYQRNRIIFSRDSAELASGFFYRNFLVDDDYPRGRYPFTYYGKRELCKISQDSFHLYSTPYKRWNSFQIECLQDGAILLIGKDDTIQLVRDVKGSKNGLCSIKTISTHVYDVEGSLGLFNLNYKAGYFDNDSLVFEGPDHLGTDRIQHFELKSGTFEDICEAFKDIDLNRLQDVYPTDGSEVTTIKLEIEMKDGRVVKTEIQNNRCPEELRLALIPVIYGHQQYVYGNEKPIE